MRVVVTGSLGHISRPLTQALVKKAQVVTVISSKPEKQKDIEALGARAAIGSLEDGDFLASTFTGADAVYCMVPPNYHADGAIDPRAFYNTVGHQYAKAIRQAGVRRVIHLSSIGAHLEKGAGIVQGSYDVENIFKALPSEVSITFLRPASFYYNLYAFIPAIKNAGVIASNYGESDKMAWVSPLDIADSVVEEVETPFTGRKVRYVASEERTCNEVAGILGAAIGKPDLKWVIISDEQLLSRLRGAGVPPMVAGGLVEMNASIHKGVFQEDYFRNRPALGKVKLADFAKDFAKLYNA